jgi:hypothetical protein
MPTLFEVFTYQQSPSQTFAQWLKAKDDAGWELITIINCSSSPTFTSISGAFKKKV